MTMGLNEITEEQQKAQARGGRAMTRSARLARSPEQEIPR